MPLTTIKGTGSLELPDGGADAKMPPDKGLKKLLIYFLSINILQYLSA